MLKTRSMVILIGIFMLVMSVTGVFAQDQTIVDIAAGNADFSTLVSLVQAADLVDVLAGEGPFTVFAPTNDAFAALPADVVAYLTSADGKATLTEILTYHVVSGKVMSADVASGDVASVEGDAISIVKDDMGVHVENASVIIPDIEASNGVIHAIDAVILPDITLPEVDVLSFSNPIVSAGSSTVGPVTEAINNKLNNEGYTGATNAITGTGAGFERFCAGETDFSNASRPIRQSEIDACLANGITPIEFRVGTDALAVVVNPANDFVTNLSLDQLALAFSTASTWADIDPSWPAEPILRFAPGTDSGTYDYFIEEVFDNDEVPHQSASNLSQSEFDTDLVRGVEGGEYAIGYFGYAYYIEEADRMKILSIDGVEPTEENVDNGTYPLARPLFIYSDAGKFAANPTLPLYINFYLSNLHEVIPLVGYFEAPDLAINLAKLNLLAGMHKAAGM